MLDHYLQGAIDDIQNLINITTEDIEFIIKANHQKIFERTIIKEDILAAFHNKKILIDNELMKIKQEHGELNTQSVPDDIFDMLDTLKEKFQELKVVNKKYAKFVLSVTEFYNSLLDKVVPKSETNGYGNTSYQSSFLKIKA